MNQPNQAPSLEFKGAHPSLLRDSLASYFSVMSHGAHNAYAAVQNGQYLGRPTGVVTASAPNYHVGQVATTQEIPSSYEATPEAAPTSPAQAKIVDAETLQAQREAQNPTIQREAPATVDTEVQPAAVTNIEDLYQQRLDAINAAQQRVNAAYEATPPASNIPNEDYTRAA